jgi:hypothetical protein
MATKFTFRVTDDEHKTLNDFSVSRGLTCSDFIRSLVFSGEVKPKRKGKPSLDLIELAKLREICAELGGALVQCAIKSREFTGYHHDEIEALIPEIKKAVVQLTDLMGKIR